MRLLVHMSGQVKKKAANVIGVDGKNTVGACIDSAVSRKVARRQSVVFFFIFFFVFFVGVLAQE